MKKKDEFKMFHFSAASKLSHEQKRNIKVFASKEVRVFEKIFSISVIGLSHLIYCDDLEYFEVSSCLDLGLCEASSFDLSLDNECRVFEFCNVMLKSEIKIEFFDIKRKIFKRNEYDVFYEFDNNGNTGIKVNGDGFLTYHSYPEYEKVVLTETKLYKM